MFDIGENLKEVLLALVALASAVAGYYFGYKRGVLDSLRDDDDKENK